ncbi:UNVERIFIED_CONTAM: hypothetical protein PYX00_004735 [Menopon gallinae]|uniref:Uncharacterized protein n=1 Tax=Menopon gallinae TaxID=328185 RepID=A0AAW2I5U0_9NEOP
MYKWSVLVGLVLIAQCRSEEKDQSISETRFDPYLYGPRPGFVPFEGRMAPIVEGALYGEVPIYGQGYAHYGEPLLHKGYYGGPYVETGFNGGIIKSGINDGALVLGNKGEQIFKHGSDGGYTDGSYHQGGGLIQDGYQGTQGYKDNKHHVADDHSNRVYYNGVRGGHKDLGNGEVFDKNQGFSQKGYNALGDNELKGYQKGHRRTGFHKSYHKDESGNDESYYDSDHDEGNYESGKKYGDQFNTNYLTGMKGGQNFKEYAADEEGKGGYQGNGKLIHLNQGLKDYYGNNGHYSNDKHFGQLGGGGSSQYGKFGLQHGYQNGFNNGRSYEGFKGANFGGGFYGPYGY